MSRNDFSKPFPCATHLVIFVSILDHVDREYELLDDELLGQVENIDGFLGWQSVRDDHNRGIMISYWADIEAIERWSSEQRHQYAKSAAQNRWYSNWSSYICEIKRHSHKK